MKRIVLLASISLALVSSMAQTIQITTDKTTSLIFPFAISHVDRGTKDVLVQPIKESDHILMVKAAIKNFEPTNLSVVTTDGSVYSFPLHYEATPELMMYNVPAAKNASLQTYANGILDNHRTMWGMQDHSWNVSSSVIGIYIKDKIIYYQLRLNNTSSIDYDIDFLRFYIRDKRKGKRTATQENELKPLFVAGNTSQVKAGNKNVVVVALEKFTIPDAKYLAIELNEKNGGRHLFMKVGNSKIIRAIQLPDLK